MQQETRPHAALGEGAAFREGAALGETAARQFLLFGLRGVFYAVEAAHVREVHQLPELVSLAESAPDVAGVVNLRGRIVPVLDLEPRLGHARRKRRLSDCIIVLEGTSAPFALLVHELHRVQAIASAQIEPTPNYEPRSAASMLFVHAVARVQGEVVALLSLHALERLVQNSANTSFALPAASNAAFSEPAAMLPTTLRGAQFDAPNAFHAAQNEAAQGDMTSVDADRERVIFRERAERLMPPVESQAERGAPVALIEMQGERFGLALESVLEFSPLRPVSRVPCCPPHIIGQMNLRGEVVTLVDIGPLLQLPAHSFAPGQTQNNARRDDETGGTSHKGQAQNNGDIVVVRYEGASLGIVIDGVRDVLHLSEAEMTTSPAVAQASGARFFNGGTFHDGQLVCILDLQKLLAEGGLIADEAA